MKKIPFALLAGALIGSPGWAQDDDQDDNEVFELSPFVVDANEDSGYRAGSTLAGTRLKTELKNVGAAVSVYTDEFLADINATSLEEALSYTVSTEVAGIDGNFSGAFSGEDNTGARVESARTNRVRGLDRATLTRNYFETDIPMDTYNSKQLTIIRGPNAVLAGAGSPGGIIDGSIVGATFRDTTNFSVRVGNNGSHRGVLNLNRELIDDRLGVRFDILNEEREFEQNPAYEKDRRITASVNAILSQGVEGGLLGRTSLRASFEDGIIEGTPPNPLPPIMSTSGWFDETDAGKWYLNGHNRQRFAGINATGDFTPDQSFSFGQRPEGFVEGFPMFAQMGIIFADQVSEVPTVGLSGDLSSIQGYQGVANPGGGFLRGTGDRNRNRAGYSRTRLLDLDVFDFSENLLTGSFDFRKSDFDALNLAVEQLFWGGKAGLEFVYDKQDYALEHDIPIRGDGTEVFIDVNRTLSVRDENGDPILNPNFSRPFIITRDAFRDETSERERETSRLTGFVGHDFRNGGDSIWLQALGRHTLSFLLQESEYTFVNESFKSSWNRMAGDYDVSPSAGQPGTFRAQVSAFFYIGGPTIDLQSEGDLRLDSISTGRPEFGESYDLRVYTGPSRTYRTITATPERITSSYRENAETFDSVSFAHEGKWFNDHIVTLASYREDTTNRSIGEFGIERDSSTNGDLTRESFIVFDDPELEVGSWTTSVVGLFPSALFELPFESELRFFWNQSENFTPEGARRDVFNQDLGPPSGETEEVGVNLSVFRGKLDLRATWYETAVSNASVPAGGNPFGYIQGMMTRLVDAHNTGIDINDPSLGWHTFGFNSFIDAANAFRGALPEELRLGSDVQFNPSITDNGDGSFTYNPDSIPNYRSVSDTISEGVEFEAILNPTKNWRISLSAAKQEAAKSDVAGDELRFADTFLENMESTYGAAIFNGNRNPAVGANGNWLAQYNNEHLFNIQAEAAKSGSLLPELAEWSSNLVTRYTFREGSLKGFHVGGAANWTDQRAVGYPIIQDENGRNVIDVANPYFTSDVYRFSLNCGYRKKLSMFGQDVDWGISLFLGNVLGDDDLIITKRNPDGTTGQVRVSPEKTWNLTQSFRF